MSFLSIIRRTVDRLKLPPWLVDRLKLPNTPAVWFTGAVILVGIISWQYVTQGGIEPAVICYLCCTLGLATLISIWCTVLGGWKAYSIGVLSLLLDGWAIAMIEPNHQSLLYFLPLGIAVPCCVTVELLKLMFGKFDKLLPGDRVFEEGLQFKLSHMFIVTTVIAVLIGIGQAVGKNLSNQQFVLIWVLTVISSVLASQTLISIWAVLGKSFLFRLAIVFPTAILLSVVGANVMSNPSGREAVWTIIFSVCFVTMLTLLSLLRWENYRFVRKTHD